MKSVKPFDVLFYLLFVGSLVLPVLYICVCITIALSVALDSRGPIFFRQWRVMKDGKRRRIWKFRTVRAHLCSDDHTNLINSDTDPRLTNLGRFLRRYRLDELPQLLQAIPGMGPLSIVGPRPMMVGLFEERMRLCPSYVDRVLISQGIFGLGTLCGREVGLEGGFESQLALDRWYIEHQSFALDLWIVSAQVLQFLGLVLTPWFLPSELARHFRTGEVVIQSRELHTQQTHPLPAE